MEWVDHGYLLVFRAVHNWLRRRSFGTSYAAECAREATQHAFLKLVAMSESDKPVFDTSQAFVGYLRTSAINYVKEQVRRKAPILLDDLDSVTVYTDDRTDHLTEAVKECLTEELDPAERLVMELKYEDELTDIAIGAKVLPSDGQSEAALGQRLRRKRLVIEEKILRSLAKKGFIP